MKLWANVSCHQGQRGRRGNSFIFILFFWHFNFAGLSCLTGISLMVYVLVVVVVIVVVVPAAATLANGRLAHFNRYIYLDLIFDFSRLSFLM